MRWQGRPMRRKANFEELAPRYPNLSFLIAEVSYDTAESSKIIKDLPDHGALGMLIWGATPNDNR